MVAVQPLEAGVADAHIHAWPDEDRPGWDDAREALGIGTRVHRVALVTPGQPPGDDAWTLEVADAADGAVAAVVRADALDDLDAAALAGRARGVRVNLGAGTATLVSVAARVADLGLSVCVQNPTGDWATVARAAASRPSQRFLVDHLGHPDVEAGTGQPSWQRFLELAAHPNVAVKLPNLVFFTGDVSRAERLAPHVAAVLDAFGGDRLLWASDWPNTGAVPYEDLLEAGQRLVGGCEANALPAVFADNHARWL